jgi:hypothetical protein
MERQLRVRLLSWRIGRAVHGRRGALFGLAVLALLACAIEAPRLPEGTRLYASACIPYTLQLPSAWRAQPVPMPDCGAPVLFDEYHLFVDREQLTLTVQAVSLAGGRFANLIGLPQSAGSVTRHGGGGQVYASLLERRDGVTIADASFTRPPLSYLMTIESDGRVNPEPVLIQAMAGWSPPAGGK